VHWFLITASGGFMGQPFFQNIYFLMHATIVI